MSEGRYVLTDLIKLLAQNVTSFTKKYLPTEHPRIEKYLHTRSLKYKHITPAATQKIKGKGKGPPFKKFKANTTTQRAWTYVQEPIAPTLSAPAPYLKGKSNNKGKSKGKFSSKGKGLGKGKHVPLSKGKGKKGKGKGKNGQRSPKGSPGINSGLPESSSRPEIKCHFCHIVGHIKPKCRKWLALSESERYQQKNSHDTKYQLIYDHLEDSVLAPTGFCQYCSDSNCDGQNCESPFDHNDYIEASLFFTQSLEQLVVNAKLERPLDSHAPQMEHAYHYDDDAWGEHYKEHESEGPWDLEGYEEEAYPVEAEDHDPEWDPESDGEQYDQNHALEEDDQGIYE
jgi:hypothetical protein